MNAGPHAAGQAPPDGGAAVQRAADGTLAHLLTLDGIDRAAIEALLDRAQALVDGAPPADFATQALCTLFFEPSTRTRLGFQRAAQRLRMDVLNFDAATSSTTKGETAIDTLHTIAALGVRAFAVRHGDDGAVAALAAAAPAGTALVNAGDGRNAHPTQGLLDMLTLRQARGRDFSRLRVLVVGDVAHSRVARSDLHALRALGTGSIVVCAPPWLMPEAGVLEGCETSNDLDAAIVGADAIFTLRLQRERMAPGLLTDAGDYHRNYGIDARRLARAAPDAVLLHPGPVNRGVEVDSMVADGAQSLILRQVANGVPMRMAVLESLLARN